MNPWNLNSPESTVGWIVTLAAVLFAYLLGRRSRTKDMRVEVFRKAMTALAKLDGLVGRICAANAAEQTENSPRRNALPRSGYDRSINELLREYDDIVMSEINLSTVLVRRLFSGQTFNEWTAALEHYRVVRNEVIAGRSISVSARQRAQTLLVFVSRGTHECGLHPYGMWKTRVTTFAKKITPYLRGKD